ncbi:MAG: hypothetical protein IPM24_02700 [Bryobacterales bacterium]|nr:hypothetical protein [Bryobacterales bacterium]
MSTVILVGNIARCGRPVLERELGPAWTFLDYPCDLSAADVVIGGPVTTEMIAAMPRLRLVHSPGAGYETIALDALPRGVPVCNVYHHESAIAEHVLMVMLALDRGLIAQDRQLRNGRWEGSCVTGPPLARELAGRTLGVVGLGHIGRSSARLAEAFGMATHGIGSRHQRSDLERLLASSDFVLISCPLSPRTRGLIGMAELRLMRPEACLINVARGPVVDEDALYEALRKRGIRGAALDVWYQYPRDGRPKLPSDLPFHELDNVILTPHSSGWTEQVLEHRFRDVAANLRRLDAGEPLVNMIHR